MNTLKDRLNSRKSARTSGLRTTLLTGAAALGLTLAVSTGAHAQSTTQPEVNLAPSPIQELGQTLYNDGIYLNSRYLGEFAYNPVGGQRQGGDYAGELNFGATIDLQKLAGVTGGSVHVLFTQRHGRANAFDDINNSVSTQQIYGGGQTFQLTELTYEQKMLNDMLDVQFGRTDLGDDFVISPFYCDFQSNAVCGNPNELGKITSTTFYPVSLWGGRAIVAPNPNTYIKIGAYQSAPGIDPQANHGFNWAFTQRANGFLLPIEAGVKFDTPGAVAPNQYDAGVIFDRTHYSAPFYNSVSPGQFGRTAVYVQGQQMVYQPYANKPQGVYLFAEAMVGLSGGKQASNFQAEAGMIWQGPLPSRPDDNIGILINGLHYNNRILTSLYDIRLSQYGVDEFPNRNLIMTEIHYAVQVNKWLNLMPNFQYIVNPDGQGFPAYPAHNVPNAAVFGIQLFVDLPSLLGIPTKS